MSSFRAPPLTRLSIHMTTATLPLADLARRFRFNESLLATVTTGFSPDDWAAAPATGGNNPIWILGHVVTSRRFLVRRLGPQFTEEPWEKLFKMGTQPQDPAAYPSPATLANAFRSAGEALSQLAEELDEEAVTRPFGTTFPDGSDTLEGGAAFLYMHEVYHLGQIGLLRRIRGRSGFA